MRAAERDEALTAGLGKVRPIGLHARRVVRSAVLLDPAFGGNLVWRGAVAVNKEWFAASAEVPGFWFRGLGGGGCCCVSKALLLLRAIGPSALSPFLHTSRPANLLPG